MAVLQLRHHIPLGGTGSREVADGTESPMRVSLAFERFGVYTCNWNIDPYIDAFREFPNMGYLDMGMASDLPRVKETFDETRRAVIYWPTKLVDASLEEIQRDMATIFRDLAPCDVVMADMQASTPDSRVLEFLEICSTLESGKVVQRSN